MGVRLVCAAGVCLLALLLLLTAALLRLLALLVQLLTVRYTLALSSAALAFWFVDSRRRRYAKGFYSCSRVPLTPEEVARQVRQEAARQEQEAVDSEDEEQRHRERSVRRRQRSRASEKMNEEEQLAAVSETSHVSEEGEDAGERASMEDAAAVAPVGPSVPTLLPVKVKELKADEIVTSTSETESEDDDSEMSSSAASASASASASAPSVFHPQSASKHRYSLEGGRRRSNTGELQRREATRPRSSSAMSDWMQARRPTRVSRSSAVEAPPSSSPSLSPERKPRLSSSARRCDTFTSRREAAMSSSSPERRRRLSSSARGRDTSSYKQEAFASSRSSSGSLEDALRSDGYWIGDFRVQRRLVPRRGYGNSPKAN